MKNQRVQPGQKIKLDAQTWNGLVNAAREVRGDSLDVGTGDYQLPYSQTTATVKNNTAGTLDQFSCVEIESFLIGPTASLEEFQRNVNCNVKKPTGGTVFVAILLEPLAAGSIGKAVTAGVVAVQVNVGSTGHKYAVPVSGSTTMASAASGAHEILTTPGATGVQWLYIRLNGGGSGGGGGITAQELDGSPSYASTTTITFNQSQGFSLSSSGSGIANVSIVSASATQAGVVDTNDQTWVGNKTFREEIRVNKLTTGALDYFWVGLSPYSFGNGNTKYGIINTKEDTTTYIGFDLEQGRPVSGGGLILATEPIGYLYGYTDGAWSTEPSYAVAYGPLSFGSPSVAVGAWATVSGLVFKGGLYISGALAATGLAYTTAAADPTTSDIASGKVGIHKNTSSGNVFFAYNDGGTIKKVQLT